MEPMNLGSPIHSPTSSSMNSPMISGHQHGQGFLPSYLMGDYAQQSGGRLTSPSKLNRSTSQMSGAPMSISTPQTPSSTVPSQRGGFLQTPTSHNRSSLRTPAEKASGAGGPPVMGLYSNLGTPNRSLIAEPGTPNRSMLGTPIGTPRPGTFSTPMPHTPQLSFGATPGGNYSVHSSSVREEIPECSLQDAANNWITVFGFPPSAASYVLSQFSQYGTVLSHQIPPNGNWMHIRYQTKLQAQKALNKTGKVLGGSIMIGVVPCSDKSVVDSDGVTAETNDSMFLNQSNFSESEKSVANINSTLGTPRSIRPLTQAYKTSQHGHDVSMNADTPNKSNGIVGKAVEYIFGW